MAARQTSNGRLKIGSRMQGTLAFPITGGTATDRVALEPSDGHLKSMAAFPTQGLVSIGCAEPSLPWGIPDLSKLTRKPHLLDSLPETG